MSTLKIPLTLLLSLNSLLGMSQSFLLKGSTYIGKTKEEVSQIMETANLKLFHKEEDGHHTQLVYLDSLNSMAHHFAFARTFVFGSQKCFSYFVNIDRTLFEKTKAELIAKCGKKISDAHAVQISGTKKYIWWFIGSDKSNLCFFEVEKYRRGRNYR